MDSNGMFTLLAVLIINNYYLLETNNKHLQVCLAI